MLARYKMHLNIVKVNAAPLHRIYILKAEESLSYLLNLYIQRLGEAKMYANVKIHSG